MTAPIRILPADDHHLVIRTPDQRLRVFVSSALSELPNERSAVLRAISGLRLIPVMFESGARPHPPEEVYRAYLAQSDIFIGLYGQRYGQLVPGLQISGLEEEFDLSQSIPRLLYVKAPSPDRDPRLTALLSRIKRHASYRKFGPPTELARLVRDDLATLLSERFAGGPRAAQRVPRSPGTATSRGPRPLPVGTTTLLGREQAISEVARLIAQPDARLVTLTGPGGVGKTRLAVAVGERVRDRFSAGTAFVPLATVTQPELLVAAIARAVETELSGTRSPLDALAEQLGDGAWLLILDNLEQVVGAAHVLNELLARCSGVAILATSLKVLRLRAEQEYPVLPLPLPADDATVAVDQLAAAPAIALFVDRARKVRLDFALTDRNAWAVVAICRRLEGLPLAIELAAARIRTLTPEALLARLATSLDALGTGMVDLPDRQHTLRATVEWSMGLLENAERSMLETATVFVDSWCTEALARVTGLDENRVFELTESLVGHSLIQPIQLEHTACAPRWRMLDTIREFVAERLTARLDFAEVQSRHAAYYRVVIEQADRALRGIGNSDSLELLQLEASNLAAAVRWYLAHDPSPLPHLFRILFPFWEMLDGADEACAWVQQLMPATDSLPLQARAELLWAAAGTAVEAGDDPATLAAAERLRPLMDGLSDPFLRAVGRLVLAWTSAVVGDVDDALRGASDALAELRRQDEPYWTTVALITVGILEPTAGHIDSALGHVREARDFAERIDSLFLVAIAKCWLGTLAVMQGRLEDARRLLTEALDLSLTTGTTRTVALCLAGFARLALVDGHPEQAARLAGAADGLRRRAARALWPPLRQGEAELVAQVRDVLGADRFNQAFAAGSRLDLKAAVGAAREGLRADH